MAFRRRSSSAEPRFVGVTSADSVQEPRRAKPLRPFADRRRCLVESDSRACPLLGQRPTIEGPGLRGGPARRTLTRQNWPRFSKVAIGQFSLLASHPERATGTVPKLSQNALRATIQEKQRSRKFPRSLFRRHF